MQPKRNRVVRRNGQAGWSVPVRRRAKAVKLEWAKEMRSSPTPAEAALWEMLRMGRLGFKFRRQAIVRGYIVDFWCPKAGLVVEVGHEEERQSAWDPARQEAMDRLGITTLRVTNGEVLSDLDGTVLRIFLEATKAHKKISLARKRKSRFNAP